MTGPTAGSSGVLPPDQRWALPCTRSPWGDSIRSEHLAPTTRQNQKEIYGTVAGVSCLPYADSGRIGNRRRWPGSPQQGTNTCLQFADAYGLGHGVVCSMAQAVDFRAGIVRCCERYDGYVG